MPDDCTEPSPAPDAGRADAMKLGRRDVIGMGATVAAASMAPAAARAARLGAATVAGSARDAGSVAGPFPQRALMTADLSGLLDQKNLSKPVHDRLVIDEMEDASGWFASDVVTLERTGDRFKSGSGSLRFRTFLRNEAYIRKARSKNGTFNGQAVLFAGQPFSAFIAKRMSPPQDWSRFNRLSFWCYVHPTTNPVNSLCIQFLCEGATAGPSDPVSVHYFGDLKPGEWNHLVWEIPEHKRDRISQVVLFQSLAGTSVAGASPEIVYDLDLLCVERVDAERVGGWAVTPGKIAYSHLGYTPSGGKVAVATDGPATFDLVDAQSGTVAATFPASTATTRRGTYRLLEFSSFAVAGRYRLRHGATTTEPFAIGEAAWRPLVEATLNAFYGFRCGFAVAGAHDACHLDVFAEHDGERRSIGGGWHDAANLTQGPYRTHLSIYALIELHDALVRQGDARLAARALEEARWGLDWSLRCRFGPGLRALYGEYSYWTDSKVGTLDDVLQDDARAAVGRDAYQNTLAALATARASRALRRMDPALASRLLRAAEEDYADVVAGFAVPKDAPALEINVPSWRDKIAYLTLSAVEIGRATGKPRYANDAVRFAKLLIATQERRFVDGVPITGYFYEDPGRTRIVHEYHNSFEDGGLLAFAALCKEYPEHADWMDWYAGLSIYADFFCARGSVTSAPFSVVPAAVWRRTDLDASLPPDETGQRIAKGGPTPVFPTVPTPALIRDQMVTMFEAGVDLGSNQRLRVFPLWSDHIRHGATTVHMSKTIGLSAAAEVMGRADLSDLAARQLEWTIGANPLSRSLIYGVGHDYWQNFTVSLPNFVGGMSLGFNSYADDAPAWGNNATFPYKEVWVYSSCRIAHNLARVGIPARVSGRTTQGATFYNLRTRQATVVRPGRYDVRLPAGEYEVRYGGVSRNITLAHAMERVLTLDPTQALELKLDLVLQTSRGSTVRLTATGSGRHRLNLRTFNVTITGLPDSIELHAGQVKSIDLVANAESPEMPWIMAIVPDVTLADRVEVTWPQKNAVSLS